MNRWLSCEFQFLYVSTQLNENLCDKFHLCHVIIALNLHKYLFGGYKSVFTSSEERQKEEKGVYKQQKKSKMDRRGVDTTTVRATDAIE